MTYLHTGTTTTGLMGKVLRKRVESEEEIWFKPCEERVPQLVVITVTIILIEKERKSQNTHEASSRVISSLQ